MLKSFLSLAVSALLPFGAGAWQVQLGQLSLNDSGSCSIGGVPLELGVSDAMDRRL